MSILSNLKAKSKPWEPTPGVVIQIYGLNVSEGLEDISNMGSMEGDDLTKTMTKMIVKTLKKSIPDASDEEIADIGLEHFQSLMEVIYDVNNLRQEEMTPEKLQKLKQMKEAYKKR